MNDYDIIEEIEIEEKLKDRFLLLYLLSLYPDGIDEERLHCLVFIAQKAGVPFSYRDWVWKDN